MPRRAPHGVGESIMKKDAPAKVTGVAQYVDDLRMPGMLHGATVRSTVAAGRLRMPGMLHGATVRSTVAAGRIHAILRDPAFDWSDVTVVDHTDIPGPNVVALIEDDQPALAAGETRHAEEPI